DTSAPGVKISPRLHAQYPKEMTIVLQHQFWDLTVTEDRFEVGLSFGGIPERLVVPFDAVNGFFDPSVQFGLQFEMLEADDDTSAPQAPATTQAPAAAPAKVPAAPALAKSEHPKTSVPISRPPPSPGAASEPAVTEPAAADKEKSGAEVVR